MARCIGCGIEGQHDWIGVGRADLATGEGDMVAHPVCAACQQDPAHRTLGNPKVTYFPAASASMAVTLCQALQAQSKAGGDQGIGG